jgi:hypothetical protein
VRAEFEEQESGLVNCTSQGKPLCQGGVQSRYEAGRGVMTNPCPICRPEEFEAHLANWKPGAKAAAPAASPAQESMFGQGEYPG